MTELTPREQWQQLRFREGFDTNYKRRPLNVNWNRATILPLNTKISQEALELVKQGVEFYTRAIDLDIEVEIKPFDSRTLELLEVSASERKRIAGKNEVSKSEIIFETVKRLRSVTEDYEYIVAVDDCEFIYRHKSRVTGHSFSPFGTFTITERALTKGRFLDGKYIPMSSDERAQYMKKVAAHECSHLFGCLDEEDLVYLKDPSQFGFGVEGGYEIVERCVGRSAFVSNDLVICDHCVDGATYYWDGLKQREDEK